MALDADRSAVYAVAAYLAGWTCRMTVETAVAEGDIVMVRWTMRARHTGDYLGVPPTGREAAFTEIHSTPRPARRDRRYAASSIQRRLVAGVPLKSTRRSGS